MKTSLAILAMVYYVAALTTAEEPAVQDTAKVEAEPVPTGVDNKGEAADNQEDYRGEYRGFGGGYGGYRGGYGRGGYGGYRGGYGGRHRHW